MLFTSSLLLEDLADVLERGKFASLLTSQGITPAFVMQRYGMLARLVDPRPIERTVRDLDDDAVIATALAAKADLVVSGDRDLRVLNPCRGMPILNATDALEYVLGRIGNPRRRR